MDKSTIAKSPNLCINNEWRSKEYPDFSPQWDDICAAYSEKDVPKEIRDKIKPEDSEVAGAFSQSQAEAFRKAVRDLQRDVSDRGANDSSDSDDDAPPPPPASGAGAISSDARKRPSHSKEKRDPKRRRPTPEVIRTYVRLVAAPDI